MPDAPRPLREGRRPGDHRRARPTSDASTRSSTTRTRIPTAGDAARRSSTGRSRTWFAADVRRGRRPAPGERARSAGIPSTSSTGASATGSRTTSTGRCRATGSGERRSRSGAARVRPRHVRRVGRRALGARRAATCSDLDLHRPDVDDVAYRRAPTCGGRAHARRAGARRVVRLGRDALRPAPLPVRDEDDCSPRRFPADFICEAIDQTRGWFYSLLAVNTLVFDRSPLPQRRLPRAPRRPGRPEDVEVDGQRHRPVDDPRRPRRRRAALVLLLGRVPVDEPTRRRGGIDESTRRFLLTLWNTYSFFVTYAKLDGWEPATMAGLGARHASDRTCSTAGSGRACTSTVGDVTDRARGLRRSARPRRRSSRFVDDLSNWYVRRSRATLLEGPPTRTRTRRSTTASRPQHCCSRPLCPFLADEMYGEPRRHGRVGPPRRLARGRHRCARSRRSKPRVRSRPRGRDARSRRSRPRRSSRSANRCRRRARPAPGRRRALSGELRREVADELNVKHVERRRPRRPPRAHGRPQLPPARAAARQLDAGGEGGARRARRGTRVPGARTRRSRTPAVDGEHVELSIPTTSRSGRRPTRSSRSPRTAATRSRSTPRSTTRSRLEGIARELVRAINDLRKALGLELSDRIRVASAQTAWSRTPRGVTASGSRPRCSPWIGRSSRVHATMSDAHVLEVDDDARARSRSRWSDRLSAGA